MENFIYHNPTKIVFGKQQLEMLPNLIKSYQAKTILLVSGKSSLRRLGIHEQIVEHLNQLDIKLIEETNIRANPSLESVLSGRKKCLDNQVDFILAAGGGSVVDAAKAIAFSVNMREENVWDAFLNKAEFETALPIGVILTLAATGSESNGNTVITNDDTEEKRSVMHSALFPRFAIIDPTYTQSVDMHYVMAGCIDIIMHVFEQYFSNTTRTETSDYMSVGIIKSVIENTKRILHDKDDYPTRANISWAATLALNWLLQQGKVGDWATHRLSYPITQKYDITHGFALAIIYPSWLKTALDHNPTTMERRLKFLGKELFDETEPRNVIDRIAALLKQFKAPTSFKDAGLKPSKDEISMMVNNALALGAVGTVVKIDKTIAHSLFELACE